MSRSRSEGGAGQIATVKTAYPIGELFEITTDHGLVYAQYTHEAQEYGSLLRILPGFYEKEPRDLASLVAGPTRQVCFANLPYYVKAGRFRPVGEQEVPKHARSFPLFKQIGSIVGGVVTNWYLWNGSRYRKIGNLRPEHYALPQLSLVTEDLFLQSLTPGFREEETKAVVDHIRFVEERHAARVRRDREDAAAFSRWAKSLLPFRGRSKP